LFSLGNYGREIFSKGHQQFVLADLDVTVSDSSQTIKAIEEIKLLSKELAIATGVNTSFLFDIIGNESLSHVKELAKSAFESGKEDKIEELTTKLQEANGQLQQYYAELQRLQQSGAELKAQELQFKDKELEEKTALEKTKQKIDRDFNLRKLENDNKRIQLEHLQLAYVPGSKEIRNN
jgi:phage portal protein BeeE